MGKILGAIVGAVVEGVLKAFLARQDKRDTFDAGATAAGLNAAEAALERARRAVRNRDMMRSAGEDEISRWLTNPEGRK